MEALVINSFLQKLYPESRKKLIRPISAQTKSWKKANRRMGWGIRKEEFDKIGEVPLLMNAERTRGYIGTALFYGFGDDGHGNADPVLSGKLAWEYACRSLWRKTWQCEYIDFDKPDHIRLRPGAPVRPKGFYFARFQTWEKYQTLTVSQVRHKFGEETGLGPEGIQLMAITHTYFQDMMNDRKIPFIVLADYDVAPYGFNDFFDAVQMFCSLEVLGLGIGNVDRTYPLFEVPALRLLCRPGGIENAL